VHSVPAGEQAELAPPFTQMPPPWSRLVQAQVEGHCVEIVQTQFPRMQVPLAQILPQLPQLFGSL
jgi:hypothetical protein